MKISRIQIITIAAASLPVVVLFSKFIVGDLSANPIQTATILTGRTALYLLFISLYCSPLFNLFDLSIFIRIRKTTGLFAFYYALIHFLIFSVLDYQLNLSWILPEIKQKPFLQIGLAALALLILLAVTSIQSLHFLLGALWEKIHKLVYLVAAFIMVHIALASKGDLIKPVTLIFIFIFAMLWRIPPLRKIHFHKQPKWARDLNTFLTH